MSNKNNTGSENFIERMYSTGVSKLMIISGIILLLILLYIYKNQTVKLCAMVCKEKYSTNSYSSGLDNCICYFNQNEYDITNNKIKSFNALDYNLTIPS